MNLTLYALSASFLLHSPMMSSSSFSMKQTLKFNLLSLNHFDTNFIYGKSHKTDLSIIKSSFYSFIKSPIRIESARKIYKEEYTDKIKVTDTDFLEVLDCVFINCSDNFMKMKMVVYQFMDLYSIIALSRMEMVVLFSFVVKKEIQDIL